MDYDTQIKIRATIADFDAKYPALKKDIEDAIAAGIPAAQDHLNSLNAAKDQVEKLRAVYGEK
jgi:hypothetical protein